MSAVDDAVLNEWYAGRPVRGVVFNINDPVRIASGEDAGRVGSVISILEVGKDPLYLVELEDGHDRKLLQSQLNGFEAMNSDKVLTCLQRWYATQCDGDWEHRYGVEIGTLDNPGWFIKVDLSGTDLEAKPHSENRNLDHPTEWIHCRVVDGQFIAHGGPLMLERLCAEFLAWAEVDAEGCGRREPFR